jgi:hypothetical protein
VREVDNQRLVESSYPSDLFGLLAGVPEWLGRKFQHSGTQLAIVFGCGPSLEDMGIEFWNTAERYLSCGVNGFPILTPVIDALFTPDIWLCIDAVRDLDKPENYPGVRKVWEACIPGEKPLRLMSTANRSSTVTDLYIDHRTDWGMERGFCKYGRSSVQAATHWIINEFSPKKIAMFGLDYKGPGRAGGLPGNTSHQPGRKLEKVFSELYESAKESGTELVNCSPETGLRAIPKSHWKEVLL